MLSLDEPAAGLDQLGVNPGQPAVVVFCADLSCPLPELPDPQVVLSVDPELGPAVRAADRGRASRPRFRGRGRLRYRTIDPGLARHEAEIRVLVAGLS